MHFLGLIRSVWVRLFAVSLVVLLSGNGAAQSGSIPAPTISAISPTAGSSHGGTVVRVTGTNFRNGAIVQFGLNNATLTTFVSATQLKATTPAASKQTDDSVVGVTVVNPDNQQAFLPTAYNYHLPPSITSVSPNSGPTAGGNVVTIRGQNFRGAPAAPDVTFGVVASPNVIFNNGTTLSVTVPAHLAGTSTVTVTDADGQVASLSDAYTFNPRPTLQSVSPTAGSSNGGTVVTVTGTHFVNGAIVQFGQNNATLTTFVSPTQLKATTPAASKQTDDSVVGVTVVNPDNQQAFLASAYNYHLPPSITSVSPDSGPNAGGNVVTITGQNFRGAPAAPTVTFDGVASPNVIFNSGTKLSVTVPAGSGTVSIRVTDADGQSATLASAYRYTPAPTITSISPTAGSTAGGTTLTINGQNLHSGATVEFGSSTTQIPSVFVNSTQLTVVTPPAANQSQDSPPMGITVIDPDGQQAFLPRAYSYHVPPSITSVSPSSGPPSGGQVVQIIGQYFRGLPTVPVVTFDGTAASQVVFNNNTTLTATVPAHVAGAVPVAVTDADGQTATLAQGYTYSTIGVFSILPNIGAAGGGGSLTITGYGFAGAGADKVTFGQGSAAVTVSTSSTSTPKTLHMQTPKHSPATVPVTVLNPVTGDSVVVANGFTFTNGPAVGTISPNAGCPVGGETIEMTGANLLPVNKVLFGSAVATILSTNHTAGRVDVKSPPGVLGPVNVTVQSANGTQVIPGGFLYAPAITTKGLDNVYPGIPYTLQLTACGGVAPLSWAVIGGSSLPPGLTLNSSTGIISGSPSQPVGNPPQLTYNPIFQLTDSSSPQPFSSTTQLQTNILYGFNQGPIPARYFGMTLNDQADWPQPPPQGAGVQVGALGKGTVIQWPWIQPSSTSPLNWGQVLQPYVAAAAAHGVNYYFAPYQFPPWAEAPGTVSEQNCSTTAGYGGTQIQTCTGMPILADWQNFVTALVAQFKGQIHLYELYNEPFNAAANFSGSVAQMVQLCQVFYNAIRAGDPAALIATPSFDNANYMNNFLLGAGNSMNFDVVSVHLYGTNGVDTGPELILTRLANSQLIIEQSFPQLMSLPIWDSESSWGKNFIPGNPNPVGGTPLQQAAFTARWLLLNWSAGVARAYWYQWDDPTHGTLFNETSPGVGTTLDGGLAYKQVQTWMLGATMPAPCSANGGTTFSAIYTCNLTRSGNYQAQAVWNANLVCANGVCPTSNYTPSPMFIQYRDVFGGVHPIAPGQQVPIGAQPILLENQTTIP